MRLPRFLDVVWCRFPLSEAPDIPGPKARPVLVLGDTEDGTVVVAAYGTSQARAAPKDWEVRHEAQRGTFTTFDLLRMADIPATRDYFPARMPVLRRFPAERVPELLAASAAAQSELAARHRRRT